MINACSKWILITTAGFSLALSGCAGSDISQSHIDADITSAPDYTSVSPTDLAGHESYKNDSHIDAEHYRLQSGDSLQITIYGEEDLSRLHKISENGAITLPLIGTIQIAGMTAAQAQEDITAQYSNGYLVDPVISVEIVKQRGIYILGEVQTPGRYEYSQGANVLNIVALAGGFTYRANKDNIEILRLHKSGQPRHVNTPERTTNVYPGDIITIEERLF